VDFVFAVRRLCWFEGVVGLDDISGIEAQNAEVVVPGHDAVEHHWFWPGDELGTGEIGGVDRTIWQADAEEPVYSGRGSVVRLFVRSMELHEKLSAWLYGDLCESVWLRV